MTPVSIYTLACPTSGRVRYVGLTRDFVRRIKQYRHSAHTKHLKNWLASIGWQPVARVLTIVEETQADVVERAVIALYRGRNQADLNYTNGGEGNFSHTPEVRARLRALRLAEHANGKLAFHKPGVGAKVGAALKGRKKPPGFGARFAALNRARAGIPLSPAHIEAMRKAVTGRTVPKENRARFREAAARWWADPEYRAKVQNTNRTSPLVEAARQKAIIASAEKRRGVPLSEEHKEKVRSAHKRNWGGKQNPGLAAYWAARKSDGRQTVTESSK